MFHGADGASARGETEGGVTGETADLDTADRRDTLTSGQAQAVGDLQGAL